jgi:hypothetical protein
MKYIVLIVFLVVLGCSKTAVERNPFLLENSFDQSINLALPAFNELNYNFGSKYWVASKGFCFLIYPELLWLGKPAAPIMLQIIVQY